VEARGFSPATTRARQSATFRAASPARSIYPCFLPPASLFILYAHSQIASPALEIVTRARYPPRLWPSQLRTAHAASTVQTVETRTLTVPTASRLAPQICYRRSAMCLVEKFAQSHPAASLYAPLARPGVGKAFRPAAFRRVGAAPLRPHLPAAQTAASRSFTLSKAEGPLITRHLPLLPETVSRVKTRLSHRKQKPAPASTRNVPAHGLHLDFHRLSFAVCGARP